MPKEDKSAVNMGDMNLDSKVKKEDLPPSKQAQLEQEEDAAKANVELSLGGKSFTVPKEVAEAFEAAKAAGVDTKKLSDELKSVKAQLSTLGKREEPKEKVAKDDIGVLMFTDPERAAQMMVDRAVAAMGVQMTAKTNQDSFWSEFYNKNKDLKEHDRYVKYVFSQNLGTWNKSDLTVGEVIDKLGEEVKGDLLRMGGKEPGKGKKPAAEGGSEKGTNSEDDKSEGGGKQTVSTRNILKERADARRDAGKPGRRK